MTWLCENILNKLEVFEFHLLISVEKIHIKVVSVTLIFINNKYFYLIFSAFWFWFVHPISMDKSWTRFRRMGSHVGHMDLLCWYIHSNFWRRYYYDHIILGMLCFLGWTQTRLVSGKLLYNYNDGLIVFLLIQTLFYHKLMNVRYLYSKIKIFKRYSNDEKVFLSKINKKIICVTINESWTERVEHYNIYTGWIGNSKKKCIWKI